MSEHDVQHPLRAFLKNWVWEHGTVGTRYLDCRGGEIRFDDGKKSRFAAEQIFYISLKKEIAEAELFAAPTVHEGRLGRFLQAAQAGKPEAAGSVTDVQRAAQDCVDLVLACAYQSEARWALATYAREPMFEDEIRAAAAADIRRTHVGLREQLALYDWTVFYGLPEPLLINDTPFIDWRVRARRAQPFVSLPLGPHCLLVGTPSGKTSRAGPVLWKTVAAMGPFKEHNRFIVESARLWLVATTDEQLVAVQDRFAPGPDGKPGAAGS